MSLATLHMAFVPEDFILNNQSFCETGSLPQAHQDDHPLYPLETSLDSEG